MYWRAKAHTKAWTTPEQFRMVSGAMKRKRPATTPPAKVRSSNTSSFWERERDHFGF